MKSKGFTLIELLVVIGIIVILIAILIPALSKAKQRAQAASTSALMSNIQAAVDGYYTTFNAYPGPASADLTAGPNGPKKLSGAQNLLAGLSYPLFTAQQEPQMVQGSVTFPGGSFLVNPNQAAGPKNYATTNMMTGQPEQLSAFFSAPGSKLSNSLPTTPGNPAMWPPTGVAGGATASNAFAFPVIVDTFTDGLPILYFRKMPGVDNMISQKTPPTGTTIDGTAYFWNENSEYTSSSNLTATSGRVCPQVATGGGTAQSLWAFAAQAVGELQNLVKTGASTGARGGYILMSAGPDRIYGRATSSKGITPSDDIVVIGGN